MSNIPPTRAAALAHLEAFAPRMGSLYATGRNTDPGPGERQDVSLLSAHIRHRLITEEEVVRMALAEDLGRAGDMTAMACIPEGARMTAAFVNPVCSSSSVSRRDWTSVRSRVRRSRFVPLISSPGFPVSHPGHRMRQPSHARRHQPFECRCKGSS
jgi:hypothetical protein